MKRILFFGIFDPAYARARVLEEGFKAQGYEVVCCRVDPRAALGARKYRALWKAGRLRRGETFDQVFVLFPGHTVVWLARLLFGPRVVFDAFVSLYDSNVGDRRKYGPYALRAWRDWLLDRSSCALARVVLVDTEAHRQYFETHLGVPPHKLLVVPVGASSAWFAAGEQGTNASEAKAEILVVFYGSYIPLHGVSSILRAAALLTGEPIRFRLIGGGQEYARMRELAHALGDLPKVEFTPSLPREELIDRVREADLCLGIFGDTEKAARVIPNKVYECAALGKPIITADTSAVREAFTDRESIFLCAASAEALAEAVRALARDSTLRHRIAKEARSLMLARYTPGRIVRDLLAALPA